MYDYVRHNAYFNKKYRKYFHWRRFMKKLYSVFFLVLAMIMGAGLTLSSVVKTFADEINPKCKAEILLDAKSGTVVYSHNQEERLPIASMCKIMTLLLCFEKENAGELSFKDEITVSETAAGMGGSQVFLEANGRYKIDELIKSITVASANDACVAMAEYICGSESSFVDKMNEKAKSLGMNDTVFVNCTGLPQSGQYSCAKDVAVMFRELLNYEKYFNYSTVWTDKISHPADRVTEISNTNKLIRLYKGCDGGKTGYTSEAGHCLAATAERNGQRFIAVVISAPDGKTRFAETSNMFDYGFNNYTTKLVIDDTAPLNIDVLVENGKQKSLSVVAEKPFYIFSKKDEKRALEFNFTPCEKVKAPVNKGEIVGKIAIFENGIEIGEINVLANENIEKRTYFDVIDEVIGNWSLI